MLDLLRGELERLFDKDQLLELCSRHLAIDPEQIGGAKAKSAFVAQLVEHCASSHALPALADLVVTARPAADRRLESLRRSGGKLEQLPTAGASLGSAVIESTLGESSLSTVQRARSGDRDLRARLLRPRALVDRASVQRYLALTRLVADVDARGLPKNVQAGTFGVHTGVVHDLLDGEPLTRRLGHAIKLRRAWPLLEIVVSAVAALHARRIVHGAVHPGNVLVRGVDASLGVQLVDAGAHLLRTTTLVGSIGGGAVSLGVVGFAAPEQLVGEPPTPRSDVYSLGLLLWAVLAGQTPFEPYGPDLLQRRFGTAFEPLSFAAPRGWIGAELDDLVLQMLDADPARRPADAEAVLTVLEMVAAYSARDSTIPAADFESQVDLLLASPADEMAAAVLEAAIDQGASVRRVAEALRLAAECLPAGQDSAQARRRLLSRSAALYERVAGDPHEAEAVYRALLQAAPGDQEARAALERVYRHTGNYEALTELLLDSAEDAASPSLRGRLFAKLGGVLHTKLDDVDQARVAFTQALVEDPADPEHARAVEQLCGSDPRVWKDVLETCSRAVVGGLTSERRHELLLVMAGWYAERVGRADLGLKCYQAILQADPAHDAALARMADLYRQALQWRELADVLVRRANAAVTPALARELRGEAAAIARTELGDEQAAMRLYEQVLREDPAEADAARALTDLYGKAGRLEDCVRVLRARALATSGADRHRVLCELGRLEAERRGNVPVAIALWEDVIAEDPRNLEALRALEAAYAGAGEQQRLIGNLERQLELSVTPRAKIALLERIAALYSEEFLDRARGSEALDRILEIEPTHAPALRGLSRLCRELERWEPLLATLERRIGHADDDAARVALLVECAGVAAEKLREPARALEFWERVLGLDPGHRDALGAVASLRAAVGDAGRAVEAMDALAAAETAPERRVEHLLRAGELLRGRADLSGAVDRYKQALGVLPGSSAAARGLVSAYLARGDVRAAAETLERALEAVRPGQDAADLAVELARLAHEKLADAGRARHAASLALEHDPTHVAAHAFLAKLDTAADRLEDAAGHFDAVSKHLDRFSAEDAVALLRGHAEVLCKLARRADAAQIAVDVVARFPDHQGALGLASELAFTLEDWPRAAELAAALVQRHASALDPSALCAALHRQGEALLRSGRHGDASDPLERAVLADPDALPPLRSLIEAYRSEQRWVDLSRTLARLLERVSGDARADVLVEIGDLAAGTLGDATTAVNSFVAALAERPRDRRILLRLLQVHSAERDWAHLIDAILRLVELTDDAAQKAKYLQTAAQIAATEQNDPAHAMRLLDRALDLDPLSESLVAQTIEQKVALGDSEGVRLLLERQIQAAARMKDRARALAFVRRLADLHLAELRVEDAVAVNEAALELAGVDPEREQILGELYAADPVRFLDRSVRLHRAAIARDAYRAEPYQALLNAYSRAKRHDGAWCAGQALVALGHAGVETEKHFKRHRSRAPVSSTARMTEEDWAASAVHPDVDPALTRIFFLIHPIVTDEHGRSLEELGLRTEDALDPADHPGMLPRSLRLASDVLGIRLPLLFEDAPATVALRVGRGQRRLLLLSSKAVREPLPPLQAACVAAAHLCYFRTGFYLRTLLTRAELKAWTLAAIKLIVPGLPLGAEIEQQATRAHKVLELGANGALRQSLAQPVDELLKRGGRVDVGRWISGVDLTSDRVGLIVCDDLPTALAVVRAAGDSATAATVAERAQALLEFSVSREYLTLRDHMRIGLDWRTADEFVPDSEVHLVPPKPSKRAPPTSS